MTQIVPHILIIGGDSRIARVLAKVRGKETRSIVRRSPSSSLDIVVTDYGDLPAHSFDGIDCAVNCVGISSGEAAELQRVNVDIPFRAAQAAKAAGVRCFIHISSFSVYGGAREIDRTTPVAPTSDYGRSKLAADEALLQLCDDSFSVSVIRLPLIYGKNSLGKVGQLLGLWQRLRVFPVPADDVSRAMIGVDMSAHVIDKLCSNETRGIVFAADPEPFSYAAMSRASRGLHVFHFPQFLASLAERVAPGLADRLFADSRLADADNLAVSYGLKPRLYADLIAAMNMRPR